MVALGLATWGIANLGWMYYENLRHEIIPPLSVVRILFDTQGVFFAIALFLDKEKDSPRFDAETLLDSVQIAIVFFSGFFGLYYVQILSGGSNATTDAFMTWSYQVINVSLVVLSAIVTLMVRTKRLRALYGGLTAFLTINAVLAGIADYVQSVHNVQTGTWYDLGWTTPFLLCAIWAAWWQEPVQSTQEIAIAKRKSLGALAFRNVMLGVAPLIVLSVVAQLGTEWRRMGLLLLGISVLCYAARLAVSQYHEALQRGNDSTRHAGDGFRGGRNGDRLERRQIHVCERGVCAADGASEREVDGRPVLGGDAFAERCEDGRTANPRWTDARRQSGSGR